jgi:fructose/tagatose bisphosphate aldolase
VIQGPVRQNAILSIAAARQSPVLITVSAENSVIISSSFNLLHPAVSYLSVITTSRRI